MRTLWLGTAMGKGSAPECIVNGHPQPKASAERASQPVGSMVVVEGAGASAEKTATASVAGDSTAPPPTGATLRAASSAPSLGRDRSRSPAGATSYGRAHRTQEDHDLSFVGACYRSEGVEGILDAIRNSHVKREPGVVSHITAAEPHGLDSQQLQLIKNMKQGSWRFDPAQNPDALLTWEHKIRNLAVEELLQTHREVSETFLHGPHRGKRVNELTEELMSGKKRPGDITLLVVVRFVGQNWVVFGNRRLKALKDFQMQLGRAVKMPCIVHDLDTAQDAPFALIAKLIDAASTQNGGVEAFFRQKRRWI